MATRVCRWCEGNRCEPESRNREGTIRLGRFFELQTASRSDPERYAYITLVCPVFEFAILGPGHAWEVFIQRMSPTIGGHIVIGPFSFEWDGPEMWQTCGECFRKYGL